MSRFSVCEYFAMSGIAYLIYSLFFPLPVLSRGNISKMVDQVIQAGFANIADFFWISGQLKQGGFGPFHSLNVIVEDVELHNALSY